MSTTRGVSALALAFLLVGCGAKTGMRGNIGDHNPMIATEYTLVLGVGRSTRVVESGTGYEGIVRTAEAENKVTSLTVATMDRTPQTVEVEFEKTPPAISSFRSALAEAGGIQARKGTWLHEKAVAAFRTRDVPLNGDARIVSFKAFPLTLYSGKNEPNPRPSPGVKRRGKL
jgi:hypothetical protein